MTYDEHKQCDKDLVAAKEQIAKLQAGLKQLKAKPESVKEIEEFFGNCTDWFKNLPVSRKADLYGYKGEVAIDVALEHIRHLLNNYQNVDSFREGYLELNRRNIEFRSTIEQQAAENEKLEFEIGRISKPNLELLFENEKLKKAIALVYNKFDNGSHSHHKHFHGGCILCEIEQALSEPEPAKKPFNCRHFQKPAVVACAVHSKDTPCCILCTDYREESHPRRQDDEKVGNV